MAGRVTFDVDLVIQLQPDNVERAMQALESQGYRPLVPVPARQFADPAIRESWIQEKNLVVFQLHSDQHRETRIDLFVTEPFDFDTEYDRALGGEIAPDLPVRFVCLETLIKMKEGTGRDKDQQDIRQLKNFPRTRRMKVDQEITQSRQSAWDQHELDQLKYFRSLPLRAKLEAVEGMADVIRRFEKMRKEKKFYPVHLENQGHRSEAI